MDLKLLVDIIKRSTSTCEREISANEWRAAYQTAELLALTAQRLADQLKAAGAST